MKPLKVTFMYTSIFLLGPILKVSLELGDGKICSIAVAILLTVWSHCLICRHVNVH